MKRPTEVREIFTEDSAQKFADILKEAVTDYIKKMDSMQTDEWLKGYLETRLTNKSADEIEETCRSILDTVKINTEKTASLNAAFEQGESAENWFVKDVLSSGGSPGEIAKRVVECDSALVAVSNSFEDEENQGKVINVDDIPADEWADDKWNEYKLKDALRQTVADAARAALYCAADELSDKVMQNGFDTALSDESIIPESLLRVADSGLKVATAGAVKVAEDGDVIAISPKAACGEAIANIACAAVENMRINDMINRGEISSVDGMVMKKNNMIAAAAGAAQKQGASIGAAIGDAFGPVGIAIGGFVGGVLGKFVGVKVGQDIVSENSKILNAAKNAVTALRKTIEKAGNKIKNLFNFA